MTDYTGSLAALVGVHVGFIGVLVIRNMVSRWVGNP